MVGTLASCKTGGGSGSTPTTLVTQVAPPATTQAPSGGVFQQKTSSTATAPKPTGGSTPGTSSKNVLLASVAGQAIDATFYYDMNGPGTCGASQGIKDFGIEGGYTFCEPSDVSKAKTLKQRGTNNIVAMPSSILAANPSKYCGKKVVVTWEGKKRDDLPLFIWDGCEKCNENDGLDFSSTVFGDIAGTANCGAGRIPNKMTWEIVDETLLPYVA